MTAAAKIPIGSELVNATTSEPTNAKCQKFQTSTLSVRVNLAKRSTILTIIATGMTHRPTEEPNAMAAAEGQPTSTISRLMPVLTTIA